MCTFLGICNGYFADSDGEKCDAYEFKNYCSKKGGYGDGWGENWGTFRDYAKGGQTARVCPQCGCVNGK